MNAALSAATSRMRRHSGAMLRFGLVGIGNLVTEFAVFNILMQAGIAILAANAAGFLCANIQSYFINAQVTFRENGAPARRSIRNYGRFFLAHCLSLAISTAFIAAFADNIGPNLAKLSAVGFGFVANYSMSALFVFRGGRGDKTGSQTPL
ncbi:MAG: GtrA family protein [Pseudomonadota bacterium]